MKLILGSQSLSRKRLLENIGCHFEVMSPQIYEKAIRLDNPRELTLALAKAKASALLKRLKGQKAILITSDQVVVCRNKIREKPVKLKEALAFLYDYSLGFPAETITSVAITETETGRMVTGVDVAKIWFKEIPEDIIWLYLNSRDPFSHAGGFDYSHFLLSSYL